MAKTSNKRWSEPRAKIIGVGLNKSIEKGDDGCILVNGLFTSDNKDETGDIITRAATERAIPKYRLWGNIRYMHQPRPVGKIVGIGVEDGLAWNEVRIKVIDPQAVFEVEQGLLTALSIGAMIKFDDVDFLEDGGLIINDYQLAEISLVDHPANYDAVLKNLPVEEGLTLLARQFGMDTLARSMMTLLDREIPMTEETIIQNDAIETEPVEKVEEVAQEAALETAPEVAEEKAAPAAEDCCPDGETCADGMPACDDTAENALPVTEEVPAEAPVAETAPVADTTAEVLAGLISAMQSLTQAVTDYQKALEAIKPEAHLADEQGESEVPAEKEAALVIEPVEPEPQAAIERKGAVPETELPDGEESAPVKETGIRSALQKYFDSRNK